MSSEDGRKLPRLDEVASLAGVSAATVSRFFNNPDIVAKATAERIRAAVDKVGYVPNLMAGGLASSKSRLVAVLVPEIAQSIFNDTIEAMVNALSEYGYTVMLGLTGHENERMPKLIDAALGRRADAIILTGLLTNQEMRTRLRSQSATVIETWGLPLDPIDVAVGFSHHAAGVEVARYVSRKGYKRPHLITVLGTRAQMRHAGFVESWLEEGHRDPSEEKISGPVHFSQGRDAFRKLKDLPVKPDVVVCGSDLIAQAVIVEAQACGYRVPEDLAVVGFGNMMLSGEMSPSITTVDINGAFIGAETVSVLRRRAAGEQFKDRFIDVGFTLIERESA